MFDRRTRAVSLAPASMLPPSASAFSFYAAAADPRRPRIFLQAFSVQAGMRRVSVWAVDLTGGPARELAHTTTDNGVIIDVAYADAVDELFVSIYSDPSTDRVDVVDATTGVLKRQLTLRAPFDFIVDPYGQRIFGNQIGLSRFGFAAFDGQTGAIGPILDGTYLYNAQFDAGRGLVFVGDTLRLLGALDAVSLLPIGVLDLGALPGFYGRSFLPGRDAVGGYVVSFRGNSTTSRCEGATVERLGADGRRQASADFFTALLPVGYGCTARAFLLQPPVAPATPQATVNGRTVSFTWTLAGDATSGEFEFGFAPGQRAGAIAVGGATTLTIPGVPPGTYYLRLRGVNDLGAGKASSDVRVVVP